MKNVLKKGIAFTLALTLSVSSANVSLFITKADQQAEEKSNVENSNFTVNSETVKPKVVEEVMSDRTTDSTTFLLSNGMKQTTYYSDDIYFENEKGKLAEYDNEFVKLDKNDKKQVVNSVEVSGSEKEEYSYVNNEGDSKQFLPNKLSEKTPVVMTKENYVVSFAPTDVKGEGEEGTEENALSAKTKKISLDSKTVTNVYDGSREEKKIVANYEGKNESTELSYESLEHGLKETITLNNKPESNIISFNFTLQDSYTKVDEVGGGITIYSDDDDIVGGIEAPFMNDATKNNYSEELHYELAEVSEKESNVHKYILKLVVDENYLENASYPVVIDPTVTWNGTGDLPEAYVLKSAASTNYFSSGVKTFSVGKGSQGVFRTYFRAMKLANTVKNKYIDSATLTVYENGDSVSGSTIYVKPVANSFKCGTVNWNNQPGGTSATLASFKSKGKKNAKHEINLKTWAQNVSKGSGGGNKCYGLLFKASSESASSYVRFYGARAASYVPKLKVVYYDAPATATSVKAVSASNTARTFIAGGELLNVSWSGVSAHALSYVQYRIENSSGTDVVGYSESTHIGTTASGSKNINISSLTDGTYKIYVRGADKAGIKGTGKGATFVVDKTKPVFSSAIISSSSANNYKSEAPSVSWKVTEKNLSAIQFSVNGSAYKYLSNQNSGSEEIDSLVSGSANAIKIRAVDKAGNISDVKSFTYYYDEDEPVISASISPNTNSEKMDNSGKNPILKYTISDKTLKSYEIELNDEKINTSGSSGEVELKNVEEGENDIYITSIDKAGNDSEQELSYYKDTVAPEKGTVRITPKTGFFNSSNQIPIVKWDGITDDNLSCVQVKIDDGEYKELGKTSKGEGQLQSADFKKNGKYKITIRGIDKAGNVSEEISSNYYYDAADYALEDYTPINVYATEQIGGNTILRFATKNEKYRDDVKYQVYRSTTPNVVISEKTFVKSYSSKGSIRISGDENVTYYYKLRTVKKTGTETLYSDYSDEISSTTIGMDIAERRLGENTLNEYMSLETSNGSGQVELSKGNFVYSQDDISLPAPQLPINISRTYNSKSTEITSMGYGWRQAYDMYVSEVGDKIYYVDDSNALYTFEKKDDKYICKENIDLSLEIDDDILSRKIEKDGKVIKELELDVYYKIMDKDENIYRFDEFGRLILIEESNGTFVNIEYNNKNGRIDSVNTSKGQVVKYSYNDNGLISKIVAAPNSDKSYSYEYQYENSKLSKATFVGTNGNKIDYKYGYDNNNKLSEITDAMGKKYYINYNAERISKFIYPNGEYNEFSFDNDSKQSQTMSKLIKVSNGKKVYSEEYHFTTDGRITYNKDALGNVSAYTYDNNNKTLVTKSTDSESYYTLEGDTVVLKSVENSENTKYDTHGNIVKSVDEAGNVTEYTYDYSDNLSEAVRNQPKTVKTTDYSGKVIENCLNEYDKFGNVIKETDYIKNIVTIYTYGDDGEVSSVRELLGENVKDKDFQNTAISSSVENTEYNDDGDETEEESQEGTVEEKTVNIYDDLGNVVLDITSNSEINDDIVSKLSKDSSVNNIKDCIKGTKLVVNKYYYDEFLRTTKTTEVSRKGVRTTENKYDNNGSVIESKDEKGRITKTTLDSMNRVTKTELIVGNDTREDNVSYSYGSINRNNGIKLELLENLSVVTTTNKKGEIVGKTYTDAYGRTVREMSSGLFADYSYDNSGKLFTTYVSGVNETNMDLVADGELEVSTYDSKGRLTATINNPKIEGNIIKVGDDSIVTKNKYDNAGNQISSTDAMGNLTEYEYDNQGRISKVIENGEVKGTYKYDEFNKDSSGKYKSIEELVTYANGAVSKTITNGSDQIMSVEDESSDGNIKTEYEYDKDGELIKEIYADGSYKKYEYDIDGNQIKESSYLANGNLTNETESTYDDEGQLIRNIDKNANTPYRYTYYEYDDYGRNISVAEVNGSSTPSADEIEKSKLKYVYNVDDVIEKVYYPNNKSDKLKGIKFNYNKDKWIVSIEGLFSGDEACKIREYIYQNDGKIKTIKDYNNFMDKSSNYIQREYEYDIFDRVISMKYFSNLAVDNILEMYNYKYDKNSHVVYKKEVFNYSNNKKDEETTYEYNNLNQLKKSEKKDNLTYKTTLSTYEYDKLGNRTYEGVTTKYTAANTDEKLEGNFHYNSYNKLNQLISSYEVESSQGTATKTYHKTYKYDKKGNKIAEVDEKRGENSTFTYNVDNQLIDVSIKKNGKDKYRQHNEYNGSGQRIKKIDTTVSDTEEKTETINYYYEGSLLLYTTNEKGEKTSQNIVGDASNVFATIRYTDGQSEYFYSKDIQGSTTNIIDKKGECRNSYNYTDFGETTERISASIKNEVCYTGGVYDETTGLYYLNTRYYSPEDGVFLSQDTYRGEENDAASWNLYGYCEGDPINYTDPTGMWGEEIHKALTKSAYNKVLGKSLSKKERKRLKNIGLKRLQKNCTFPDKQRGTNPRYKDGSYHGHGNYDKVMSRALSGANKIYKNKNYEGCSRQLGIALHTIQDFYAHNVKLDGEVVTSRKVADGVVKVSGDGKFTLGKHPKYITDKFIEKYEKKRGSIAAEVTKKEKKGKKLGIHSMTADNPLAYFKKGKWVFVKSRWRNPRYKKARTACVKYLMHFVKNENRKSYKLKY